MTNLGHSTCIKLVDQTAKPMFEKIFSCSNSCASHSVKRILSAAEKRSRYFRRLFHVRHMDFEYALWQMWQLFVGPQRVFRNFNYRKCSRQQWARDDPAFLVLMMVFLIFTSLGFAFCMSLNAIQSVEFVLWVVFVDFIGISLLQATFFWIITNHFFVDSSKSRSQLNTLGRFVETNPEVEWGYAFDVHLNGFFPALCILHLLQLPFLYIILQNWFIGRLLGNTFWLMSFTYYTYITFLGYRTLPFLKRTTVLLWPVTAAAIIYVISLIMKWNFTLFLCHFYQFRLF
ncbi:hypothetical protein Smp_029040 [Schistosoma mansoni]|uniref:Protein unc-50 homolog n=1 Tax=Schistosoma mansoni TaxID=6183 RepID=G4VGT0_SCHMA|nr:hypothetical protein Smp_029040 [Schistosoma mansoni]|eukprot:XP_018650816.1 hypothetical protein Smp_029040 [Schistosoma mansoni]